MKYTQYHSVMKKPSLFIRLLIITSICIFIPTQLVYKTAVRLLEENARSKAASIATSVASFLEYDIATYRPLAERSVLEDDEQAFQVYRTYNDVLAKIKAQSNADYIYTEMFVDDQTVRFILDAEEPDSEGFSPFGSLDGIDDTERSAYERAQVTSSVLVDGVWGTFISAFAPIIDSRDGTVVGLAGVDFSAKTLMEQTRVLLLLSLLTFSQLTLLLSFSLMVVIDRYSIRAYTDELTTLGNWRALNRTLARLDRDARRHNRPFVMMTFDVDTFKMINDDYGHPIGDKVLASIAQLIKLRSPWEWACFRSGGDEFVLLLPAWTLEQAAELKTLLLRDIEGLLFPEIQERAISVSIGIAEWKREESLDDLIRRADAHLYEVKRKQRYPT